MKTIWNRILTEPAIAFGIPTILFATAAGIWSNDWLAFAAAASAGIGALLTRANVTPTV